MDDPPGNGDDSGVHLAPESSSLDSSDERTVSELIVRVNEPDIYTPTVDYSAPADPPILFHPGVRQGLRSNAEDELERAQSRQAQSIAELQKAVAEYEKEESKLWPWVTAGIAVFLALAFVVLFGKRL